MKMLVEPHKLRGEITPPPSKSLLHRYILAAALGDGMSIIENFVSSDDILASVSCARALGIGIKTGEKRLEIRGNAGKAPDECPIFPCGESGTTLRLYIPVALALCSGGSFRGSDRLFRRPLEPYLKLFEEKNIRYHLGYSGLDVRGSLASGRYTLAGNVSSQFFSGLLFGLSLCNGESEIISDTEIESADYIAMTCTVLKRAGIETELRNRKIYLRGGSFKPLKCFSEPDWSQAAFWVAANCLGGEIEICGMNTDSIQGDRKIEEMEKKLKSEGHIELDFSQCPDLLPPAAVMAAVRNGTSRFYGCARLRYKESDRLSAVTEVLNTMGADITELPDGLFIRGVNGLRGGVTVAAHNDHRIAMMASVAAACCKQPVIIDGAECVSKSYPTFFEHLKKLGGAVYAV